MANDIKIPECCQDRPLYKGLVIPFTTLIGADGAPDFKVTDLEIWFRCIDEKLCAVCGKRLDYWTWYIGGPWQHVQQKFFDPAMHEQCARYATAVCPFIAYGKQYAQVLKHHEGMKVMAFAAADFLENPEKMYLTKHRRDTVEICREGNRHFVKVGPAFVVEEIVRRYPSATSGV